MEGRWSRSYFGTWDKRDRFRGIQRRTPGLQVRGAERIGKWEKLGLCYPCLGKGHLSEACHWSKERGIDGFKEHQKLAPSTLSWEKPIQCHRGGSWCLQWKGMGPENLKQLKNINSEQSPSHCSSYSETWAQVLTSWLLFRWKCDTTYLNKDVVEEFRYKRKERESHH